MRQSQKYGWFLCSKLLVNTSTRVLFDTIASLSKSASLSFEWYSAPRFQKKIRRVSYFYIISKTQWYSTADNIRI